MRGIKIVRLDPLTEKPLEVYESYMDAERKTGIDSKNIGKAVRGERKLSGGYKWKRGDAQ